MISTMIFPSKIWSKKLYDQLIAPPWFRKLMVIDQIRKQPFFGESTYKGDTIKIMQRPRCPGKPRRQ